MSVAVTITARKYFGGITRVYCKPRCAESPNSSGYTAVEHSFDSSLFGLSFVAFGAFTELYGAVDRFMWTLEASGSVFLSTFLSLRRDEPGESVPARI